MANSTRVSDESSNSRDFRHSSAASSNALLSSRNFAISARPRAMTCLLAWAIESGTPEFIACMAASTRRVRSLAAEVEVACVSCEILDWQIADRQNSKNTRQQGRARFDELDNLAGAKFAAAKSGSRRPRNRLGSGNCDATRHIMQKAASM